ALPHGHIERIERPPGLRPDFAISLQAVRFLERRSGRLGDRAKVTIGRDQQQLLHVLDVLAGIALRQLGTSERRQIVRTPYRLPPPPGNDVANRLPADIDHVGLITATSLELAAARKGIAAFGPR